MDTSIADVWRSEADVWRSEQENFNIWRHSWKLWQRTSWCHSMDTSSIDDVLMLLQKNMSKLTSWRHTGKRQQLRVVYWRHSWSTSETETHDSTCMSYAGGWGVCGSGKRDMSTADVTRVEIVRRLTSLWISPVSAADVTICVIVRLTLARRLYI